MPKVEVNPTDVSAIASQMEQASSAVHEGIGSLVTGTIDAPGFSTADSVAQFCTAWKSSLTDFATACHSVSERLDHAGTVYRLVEKNLTEAF